MSEKKTTVVEGETSIEGKFSKVENHTIRIVTLFPTDSFPAGFPLLPGMNSIPKLFLKEFLEYSIEGENKAGKKVTRYPGREVIKQLAERVSIVGDRGVMKMGPQVTFHQDGTADHIPDGLPMPYDLSGLSKEEAAIGFLERVTDVEAIARWVVTEAYRKPVQKAAQDRLVLLKGG